MEKPLYNSKIIETYIKLVKNKYSYIDVSELLNSAGMETYEVADQGHWFTQEQVDRFYYRLVQLTGNEEIAREAGRYAASPDALGIMRQFILGIVGPATTFEIINKIMSNFTRSSTCQSKIISSNKVEIVVTPYEGMEEKPFQCENRLGLFEAIVLRFGFDLPHVEHTECLFKGGKSCRYIISWEKPVSVYLKKCGIGVTVFLAIFLMSLLFLNRLELLVNLFPLFMSIAFVFAYIVAKNELKELKASLNNTNDSTDSLLEQINSNYNNALMINEIGQALGRYSNRDEILSNVIRTMEKRLEYDRGLILLANTEINRLILYDGYGYSAEQRDQYYSMSFNLDRPQSKGVFNICFREQRPILVNDINDIIGNLSPKSMEFAKKIGSHSFICCPILCEGKSIGILTVDNVKTKKPLVQSDISLLMGIASFLGISLRNAELIEAKIRQFNSVLKVLAASIDARDSLTAGHSEMVTEYSVGICKELNLSPDDCETIRVAALLHDYGKIGVPDAILKKPGLLSKEEYAIVKTHASKTREILSQINFEGIYCKVPEIAGAHHEKLDGSGYPNGLMGHEVPLGSKIIAVADYFEAITAKRHYREPMYLEDAFQSLFEESGKKFDKRIVEAFLSYYSKTYEYVPLNADELASFSERRRTRISARVPVTFRVNGRSFIGNSEDLSIKGVFIASDEDVPEGHPVELSITIPDTSTVIEANGRIAWVNSGQSRKTTLSAGFGVELLECKDMAERFLEAFLNRCIGGDCPQEC